MHRVLPETTNTPSPSGHFRPIEAGTPADFATSRISETVPGKGPPGNTATLMGAAHIRSSPASHWGSAGVHGSLSPPPKNSAGKDSNTNTRPEADFKSMMDLDSRNTPNAEFFHSGAKLQWARSNSPLGSADVARSDFHDRDALAHIKNPPLSADSVDYMCPHSPS